MARSAPITTNPQSHTRATVTVTPLHSTPPSSAGRCHGRIISGKAGARDVHVARPGPRPWPNNASAEAGGAETDTRGEEAERSTAVHAAGRQICPLQAARSTSILYLSADIALVRISVPTRGWLRRNRAVPPHTLLPLGVLCTTREAKKAKAKAKATGRSEYLIQYTFRRFARSVLVPGGILYLITFRRVSLWSSCGGGGRLTASGCDVIKRRRTPWWKAVVEVNRGHACRQRAVSIGHHVAARPGRPDPPLCDVQAAGGVFARAGVYPNTTFTY